MRKPFFDPSFFEVSDAMAKLRLAGVEIVRHEFCEESVRAWRL
jgi:hypothetical protein